MTKFAWMASFRKGTTNLADAIAFYLVETGAPAELREAYNHALYRYQAGDVEDLGVSFGMMPDKETKKLYKDTEKYVLIRMAVDNIPRKYKRNDPSKYENTAFHKAAENLRELNLTAATLYKWYHGNN